MPIINTMDVPRLQEAGELTAHDILQLYNAMDCALTTEIYEEINPQLDPQSEKVYSFTRDLQAPALDMMHRGVRIDNVRRREVIHKLGGSDGKGGLKGKYQAILDQYTTAVWGKALNVESPAQLKAFFYGVMGLPEIKVRTGKKWSVSTNREALEKLSQYFYAQPIVSVILALRDVNGAYETMTRGVDTDGRMRCSYNIAGTITGRWSSSKNIFGGGGNLQNITGDLRDVFVSDPGKKMAYLDLQAAESRAVGFLCKLYVGVDTYLRACEAGDLHTVVSRLTWPGLDWGGDPAKFRSVAESPFYRTFSYRDMAKRGGHGSNYGGSAPVIASHLKIERKVAEAFQAGYFKAFPEIPQWHRWVQSELRANAALTTPFGRRRQFFGRLEENKTLNEAIAFGPQSLVADMLNSGLLRVHNAAQRGLPVELLMQVHDAIVIQYPEEAELEVLAECKRCLEAPLEGFDFSIPSDAEVGWNWGKRKEKKNKDGSKTVVNDSGMDKWRGKEERKRPGERTFLSMKI